MEADKGVAVGTEIGLQVAKTGEEKDKQVKKTVTGIRNKLGKKKQANKYSLFMNAVNETAKAHSNRLRFSKQTRNMLENTILTVIEDVILPECVQLLEHEGKTQLSSKFVVAAVKNKLDKPIYSGFEKVAYSSTREIFDKKTRELTDKKN